MTQQQKRRGIRQKYSDGLIKRTIEVWQPLSDEPITRDGAIAILDKMVSAFRPLLMEEAKKRRGKRKSRKSQNAADFALPSSTTTP